jgi:hypothetical protein
MKALISPNEGNTVTWVTSWKKEGNEWVAETTESISDCQRIAEVEPDDKTFEVATPLHWVDCPQDCKADEWYFKDGACYIKPTDVPKPETQE